MIKVGTAFVFPNLVIASANNAGTTATNTNTLINKMSNKKRKANNNLFQVDLCRNQVCNWKMTRESKSRIIPSLCGYELNNTAEGSKKIAAVSGYFPSGKSDINTLYSATEPVKMRTLNRSVLIKKFSKLMRLKSDSNLMITFGPRLFQKEFLVAKKPE